MKTGYETRLIYPSNFQFQYDRLVKTIEHILIIASIFLFVFTFVDLYKNPNYHKEIINYRLLTILPLLICFVFIKLGFKRNLSFIILVFGLISLLFFLQLHLVVPEKHKQITLVVIYYFLAINIMAPLINHKMLVFIFGFGFVIFHCLVIISSYDKKLHYEMIPHLIGVIIFTYFFVRKHQKSAYENYIISKKLHFKSLHDSLSKILNRKGMGLWLKEHLSIDKKKRFVMIMIDIDHFKSINDNFGHSVGDEVISEIGNVLSSFHKNKVGVARYGGEEFVICGVITTTEAYILSEQLLVIIRNLRIKPSPYNDEIQITVSIGMASFYGTLKDSSIVLKKADQLMYKAKKLGRDRIEKNW
ncbi:MAG: GGDEF domain-containing protein [Marinicella pacifica]